MVPEIPTGAIEATLERILLSLAFSRSPGLCRLLEYIVRRTLAGEGDGIKEYALGVDVFDRGEGFDPRCDPIVRVEAFNLRRKLERYYRTEGLRDIVHIGIPKGAYRPTFRVRDDLRHLSAEDPLSASWQVKALLFRSTPDALERAERLVLKAIEAWPTCADLYAELAHVTLTALSMESLSPGVGVEVLQFAAGRALRLDPARADAHYYAQIAEIRRPDKSVAIEAARQAFRLAPDDPVARYWAASVLVAEGRLEEALGHMEGAVRQAPYVPFFRTWTAAAHLYMGNAAAARQYIDEVLEVEPHDFLANYWLGQILLQQGHYDEAREAARRAYELSRSTQTLCALGYIEAVSGHTEAAESTMEALQQVSQTRYVAPSGLAAINLALGRVPRAIAELNVAKAAGDWYLGWARTDPRWKPLRGQLGDLSL